MPICCQGGPSHSLTDQDAWVRSQSALPHYCGTKVKKHIYIVMAWLVDDEPWWKNLKSRWFRAALWRDYPSKGTLALDDSDSTAETDVTAMLVDPAGEVSDVTYQWQRGDDEARIEIGGETEAFYMPQASDVSQQIRCVAQYRNVNGFMLHAIAAWSE